MPNLTGVTKFFPRVYENTVAMTLSGSITAGASTVGINGMTNYNNGDVVCFAVDPSTPSLKQVFTGTVSGTNVVNVIWTEFPTGGVNVGHAAGASVVDYVTATDWDMQQVGLLTSLAQDGTLLTAAVQKALNITGGAAGGWTPSGFAPSAVAYNGNRSYSLTFSANDLTPTLSNGMRLLMTRTATAPTRCTSLNGTSQYYSKSSPAGMTFTDDFVVSAWIKLTSYAAASIASRYNGTSGWDFELSATGQPQLIGYNGGSTNQSYVTSYQSIPLNKWVHVAAQLDMSSFSASPTTSYIMIDGIDATASVTRGGSDPTALIQAGNLEIGSRNGGTQPFPGEIAQVAIYSAKVTEATIAASANQTLGGTETSLISAYSFNNSITDLNANANNLTANGSAVATSVDNPFADSTGTTSYGIIMSIAFSTNTTVVVQLPEGMNLPTTGGISAVSYSTSKVPYKFPNQQEKWIIETVFLTGVTVNTLTASTWYNLASLVLTVPIGSWEIGYAACLQSTRSSGGTDIYAGLGISTSTVDADLVSSSETGTTPTTFTATKEKPLTLSVATPYYLNESTTYSANVNMSIFASSTIRGITHIYAKCSLR